MQCTVLTCNSKLVYTSYIRVMKYNDKTHRSKQQYVPVGLLCLDCAALQMTLSDISKSVIRGRRFLADSA